MVATETTPATLTVDGVATLLDVSSRHVYRMADGGLMPRPLKLGNLNRWLRTEIEEWLAGGAKPLRPSGRRNPIGA
jgi:excisionase family DNA binding protein